MNDRRKLAGAAGLGFLAALALTAAALGAVSVKATSTQLAIRGIPVAGGGGQDHDIVVEPYHDDFRTGYRVRPRTSQGAPPLEASTDCLRNPIANDVVCGRFSRHIEIDLGSGGNDDRVVLRESQRDEDILAWADVNGLFGIRCLAGRSGLSNVTARVDLGAGNDDFGVKRHDGLVCQDSTVIGRPFGIDVSELEVYGQAGADRITGFKDSDLLSGGAGDDVLDGAGDDDRLLGGSGNDSVVGGSGDDQLFGETGDDVLRGSDGADVADGGPGADSLFGDAGVDELRGGPGQDTLSGGDGDDVLRADDDGSSTASSRDVVSCGKGRDTAYVDPADSVSACERVFRHALGDGLPAYVTNESVTFEANGTTRLEVRCPSQAVVRCAGTLTLRVASNLVLLGQQAYDLAPGRAILIFLPVSGSRPSVAVARTVEPGQTQARSATISLPIAF